jgi:hypothetical protein
MPEIPGVPHLRAVKALDALTTGGIVRDAGLTPLEFRSLL